MSAIDVSADLPGWYGKLSTLGDFASRRLAPEVVAFIDGWLSQCMAAGREQLGESWLEVYLNAPVLRFAWAPSLVDARWWFGVLMPSCDNVGRYFPLVIVQARDSADLHTLEAWLDGLAAAALHTLLDHNSVDDFEARLGAAAATSMEAGARPATSSLAGHLRTVAAEALSERLSGCTLWQSRSPDGQLHISQGLPEPATFARLLAG